MSHLETYVFLERRSSNGVDRKSEAWLAQENTISKEKEHATSALATSSGPLGARGTDRETDTESEIICVSAPSPARIAGGGVPTGIGWLVSSK